MVFIVVVANARDRNLVARFFLQPVTKSILALVANDCPVDAISFGCSLRKLCGNFLQSVGVSLWVMLFHKLHESQQAREVH